MSDREELAELILSEFRPPKESGQSWRLSPFTAADKILAAGYAKPRQITTVEELDTLPVGSIIHRSNTKAPFLFTADGWEATRHPGKPVWHHHHQSRLPPRNRPVGAAAVTGMEDVLAAHYDVELEHGYWSCICGEEFGVLLPDELHRAHVAEALAAAGFGNLHDAWADTISRVEVIDDTGRAYTKYTPAGTVSIDRQDQGRTLKVFITEGATKKVSET